MNYYNPYFSALPYMSAAPKLGLFSRLFGGNLSFGTILSGTQKTLNIVNQTIPLVKQAGPVFKNAKTMFKVINEFKKIEPPVSEVNNTNTVSGTGETIIETSNNNPTFFA